MNLVQYPPFNFILWRDLSSCVNECVEVSRSLDKHLCHIIIEVDIWSHLSIHLHQEIEREILLPLYFFAFAPKVDLQWACIVTVGRELFLDVVRVSHYENLKSIWCTVRLLEVLDQLCLFIESLIFCNEMHSSMCRCFVRIFCYGCLKPSKKLATSDTFLCITASPLMVHRIYVFLRHYKTKWELFKRVPVSHISLISAVCLIETKTLLYLFPWVSFFDLYFCVFKDILKTSSYVFK